MAFVQNLPFISIILSLFSGPLSSILNGKWAKRLNLAVIILIGIFSATVLLFVLNTGEFYTYYMGHFPAPWGNEIRFGILEPLTERVRGKSNRYEKMAEEEGTEPGGNLRFMRLDARLLEDCFGENEVDRIYLNFSDPWPNDKNANKRLTSPMFLARYKKVLKPEGTIEFKTDNRGLFDYSVETAQQEGWEILAITYDLHADETMMEGNIETEYEAKFSAKGNKIGKMIIRVRQ